MFYNLHEVIHHPIQPSYPHGEKYAQKSHPRSFHSTQPSDETDALRLRVSVSPRHRVSHHRVPESPAPPRATSNALKHGFYSRALKERDRKGLENTIQVNLAEEIDLLRILIRRMCETFSPDQSIAEQSALLRSLSIAFLSLNRMVRTQHQLHARYH